MKKKLRKGNIQRISRAALLWILVSGMLLTAGMTRAETAQEDIVETVVEATCTEAGYRAVEDTEKQITHIEQIPARGHRFGEWTEDETHTHRTRECSVCGYTETVRTDDIPTDTLPKLYLTGSMEQIGKKQKVALEAEFVSAEQQFCCYGILTLQGHSTFGYPKKNYTIRFCDDDQGKEKHKVEFRNWRKEHKFILKSNYVDLSQSRNLAASAIWAEMVAGREHVNERIRQLPTMGAVDGFPAEVYLNGEFFGLYTLNLHKDDDLYQMKDGTKNALAICNQKTTEEASFRAPAEFRDDYSSDWEIEYCGTEDESWTKESFNELTAFVNRATDEEFRTALSERMDVDAAIDYLIFIYTMGLSHSGTKDLVMLNYGKQWIPTAFDMDEGFGLDAERFRYLEPEEFVPVRTEEGWDSGTDSLLWDRILQNYEDQIRKRYRQLRESALTEENLIRKIQAVTGQISVSLYDMDYNLYPDRPVDDREMENQIRTYISGRLAVMDGIFGGDRK